MRRDKINTLLMKQDFMVYEQQEPQGGDSFFFNSILTILNGQELKNYN